MGAILEFTNKETPDSLKQNPLLLPNNSMEYKNEIDLPFLKEASGELLLLLCQRFRALYSKEPSVIEIKHQKTLD